MKQKKNLGSRLRQIRKSRLRTKEPKAKQRYLDRIKTIVIQVAQLTKRTKALRQQLKKLNSSKGRSDGYTAKNKT